MKSIAIFREANGVDLDQKFVVPTAPFSRLVFDGNADPRAVPFGSCFTAFEYLPGTAVAVSKDQQTVSLGTGTELVTRSPKGGIKVKTQATTPADNDNAMIIGVAATPSFVTWDLTAGSVVAPRFRTRVNLTQITELQFGAGLDQNITSPIGNATAGDGAQFLFDPANESATGVTTYATNWILAQKVNGADTYLDSGVKVAAGVDYRLEIRWGADLKPTYYIDGVNVGTGVAQTDDIAVGVVVGVQINAASPAGQKDFDLRYLQLDPYGSLDA